MEVLDMIWQYVAPIFGGLSIAGIVSAIIYGCLKGAFNRTISKINTDKIAENATDKGIEKLKQIDFKHNIEPIVKSELKKVSEEANKRLEEYIDKMQTQYNNVIEILEKFAAYFDDSMICEQKKTELHNAIKNALEDEKNPATEEVGVVVVEEPKKAEKSQNSKAQDVVQGDR